MSAPPPVVASRVGLFVRSADDVMEAVGAAYGSGGLVLAEGDVAPALFDLRSGLAGELFQKCTNYRLPLALVVADPAAHGERIVELAREHRTHGLIRFFAAEDEALAWLESLG